MATRRTDSGIAIIFMAATSRRYRQIFFLIPRIFFAVESRIYVIGGIDLAVSHARVVSYENVPIRLDCLNLYEKPWLAVPDCGRVAFSVLYPEVTRNEI